MKQKRTKLTLGGKTYYYKNGVLKYDNGKNVPEHSMSHHQYMEFLKELQKTKALLA